MLNTLKGKFKLKPEYVIIAIIIALIISVPFINLGKKDSDPLSETERYVLQTESKLKKSIEKIKGVKRATVTITVNEGIKTVVAEDVKEVEENGRITKTATTVLVSGKPIVLGEIYPQIAGVVIICDCSDSMTVKMSVLDVVTMMLDVPCDRVRILTQ